MKKTFLFAFAIAVILLSLFIFIFYEGENINKKMKLTSNAFENNGKIPSKYTCDGEDINPQLSISEIPENTKSIVLIMDDPDAIKPAGKVWDHWIVFDISADTNSIEENSVPENSIQGITSFSNTVYGGPCPPDTEHRYFFKLYALDTELNLQEGSTKEEVETAMKGHIIEQTELIGRYERI